MEYKKITLLCGHYGSGKTNIAVNMAFDLKKQYDNVAAADLDIVNPYFRSKDSKQDLENGGIKLIASEYAGGNLDIPALPQEMYAITDEPGLMSIIDVGGDDRGALALGRLAPEILRQGNYEMLAVINCYRPLTRDVKSTIEVMKEIEYAGGIPFTGLINNSNLGEDTSAEDILDSLEYSHSVAEATGLPVKMTTVHETLFEELKDKIPDLFSLKLQKKIT